MKEWYFALRIKHWIKNLFVFAPAFFSGTITQNWVNSIIGFFCFCFLASCIYIINDIKDREFDLKNPSKRVSKIPKVQLYIVAVLLCASSFLVGLYLGSFLPLLFYLIINLLYTFKLKEIPFLEMILVSSGFLLRIIFGGEIINVPITGWLYSEVIILTLLIVFSKRIKELNFYHSKGIKLRKVITFYSTKPLQYTFYILSTAIVIIYILYCFDPIVINRTSPKTWVTIPFVGLGVFRFVQLTVKDNDLLNPISMLLKDSLLLFIIIGWVITWVLVYYYG